MQVKLEISKGTASDEPVFDALRNTLPCSKQFAEVLTLKHFLFP